MDDRLTWWEWLLELWCGKDRLDMWRRSRWLACFVLGHKPVREYDLGRLYYVCDRCCFSEDEIELETGSFTIPAGLWHINCWLIEHTPYGKLHYWLGDNWPEGWKWPWWLSY